MLSNEAHRDRRRPASLVRRLIPAFLIAGFVVSHAQSPAAQDTEYVVGAQDVLTVTVWGPGGLSERFTVEADGTFTFPLLGRVRAGGLTVRQLQDALTHQLADGYFKEPRVTVVVDNYLSQRVFIVGEVRSPGTYTLTRPTTLVEALTLAGSTTVNAGGFAVVRRRSDGEASIGPMTRAGDDATEIRVDLTSLPEGVLPNNLILRDGDTIAVPPAAPVYVFGHVNRQGEYIIGKGTTVRHVLSLAGGVSQRGAEGRVKIVRGSDRNKQEIKVELDDPVMPGDTLIVPERFF